ncbi:hypothetical protein ACFQ5D_19895 [Paenibacillus farraposensis]|uniref:Uncharacterized protein n=1 Tax=Paenibacillus farraposensis TaxID=2807095 RepID=A0ABW4DI61_9BACL|nr:hypothetical protein [Paenibacillus farraposensis]MCC3379613.1 hypothetical protein [Paenibacillus farraposensis]
MVHSHAFILQQGQLELAITVLPIETSMYSTDEVFGLGIIVVPFSL